MKHVVISIETKEEREAKLSEFYGSKGYNFNRRKELLKHSRDLEDLNLNLRLDKIDLNLTPSGNRILEG